VIKKIAIDQLRPGMHVHDLNFGWSDHPLARSDFLLEDARALAQIRSLGIRELYIDTDKGLDIADARTQNEVEQDLEQEMTQVALAQPPEQPPTPLATELRRARPLQRQALELIRRAMEQTGRGQPPELPPLTELIEALMDSLERNRDALLGLTRVRRIGRYTLEHSFNAAVLTIAFARTLGLERAHTAEIALGALLHDIGKSLIPEGIVNKPGALTDDELALVHAHVLHAHELLRTLPGMPEPALRLIAEHHERLDGSGYPRGRRGLEISRQGRMAAIIDVYDAITADRVYQTGLEPHLALRKLLEWSRFHFDADLVQRFIRCLGIYPVGSLVRLDSGLLGVVVGGGRKGPLQPVVRVFMNANQRRSVALYDLDLSAPGIGDRISGIESPAHWRMRPEVVLLHTLG